MKSVLTAMSLVALIHCTAGNGMSHDTTRDTDQGATGVTHEVIAEGAYGPGAASPGRRAPYLEVARDPESFERLWRENVGDRRVPEIDFSSASVVFLLMGPRPTGGYSIDLLDVILEGDVLKVLADLREPGPGGIVTQAFTAPHVVLVIPSREFSIVEWINQGRLLWRTEIGD